MSEIKAELTSNDFYKSCLCAFTQPTNLPIFLDLSLYIRIMLSREKGLKIVAGNFYIVKVDEIILNQICSFISCWVVLLKCDPPTRLPTC